MVAPRMEPRGFWAKPREEKQKRTRRRARVNLVKDIGVVVDCVLVINFLDWGWVFIAGD